MGGGVRFVKMPFQSPREEDDSSGTADTLERSIHIRSCTATSCILFPLAVVAVVAVRASRGGIAAPDGTNMPQQVKW